MTTSAPLAGKYRLLRPLGKGSMGEVWAALHVDLGREVALKLIYEGSPELAARLKREAQACGRLEHPNIVRVYDIGETDGGEPFLVMELLTGETLADRLLRRERLPAPEALAIAADVSRALSAAHQAGVIHRDLKPANVFLCGAGDREVAKVLDFGVSKIVTDQDLSVTNTGALVGSPAYMSPEQARALRDIDPRADLWAVGVLLFEMLTGARPFPAPTVVGVVADILSAPIPTLASALPGVDPRIDAVVRRCMTRELDRRMPTAAALVEALEACLAPARPADRRSHAEIDVDVAAPESLVDDDEQFQETIARPAAALHAAAMARAAPGSVPRLHEEESDDDGGETAVMHGRHMLPFLRGAASAAKSSAGATASTTQPLPDVAAGKTDAPVSEDMPTMVAAPVPRASRPVDGASDKPGSIARLGGLGAAALGTAKPPAPRGKPPPDLDWGASAPARLADPPTEDLPADRNGVAPQESTHLLDPRLLTVPSAPPAPRPSQPAPEPPRMISFGAPPPGPIPPPPASWAVVEPPPSSHAEREVETRIKLPPGWGTQWDAERVLWTTAIAGLVVGLVVFAGLSLLR